MSEPGPTPSAKHGLGSIGGGIALAIAFFLPSVQGCGMELSMADLAQEEAAHFYIYAVAAGVALLAGFALVAQGPRGRWALLAQGLAGGAAILHLLWHVLGELGDDLQAEPLWGFWVLVAGLLSVGVQPWWSYAKLGTEEGEAPGQFDEDDPEGPTDPGAAEPSPLPRSHLPARIAGVVALAAALAAAWSWCFGEIIGSIVADMGHEGLRSALPWLSGIGTMISASSGRLLSGGRAVGLGLMAGLATSLLTQLLGLTGLEGQAAFLVHAVVFGLLTGSVGGLVLGSRRAMMAGALAGVAIAVIFTLVPRETSMELDELLTSEGHAALRRALCWAVVLAAEAVALRVERR
jgi:hypothetical protein